MQSIGLVPIQTTIPNGTALTAETDLGANTLVGIALPAAWTAAALTFQASVDGGTTWLNMQTSSAELSYSAAASQYIAVDPALWRGVNAVKVRSGTASVPVNQGADRILTLITRPVV